MSAQQVHLIFSPQSCSLSLLDATLTPDRRTLADDAIRRVEAAAAGRSSCHTLLVGPRGSGKTHVLAYIRKKLRDCIVIALSEEERGIANLLDLILAVLRAMPSDSSVRSTTLAYTSREEALREATERLRVALGERPAVLVIENLAQMLSALGTEEIRRFRAFLQANPALSVLASTVELFARSARPDHPFYGFFAVHALQPLDRRQARLYLAQLAHSRGETDLAIRLRGRRAQARVDAIYDLTGGNHRLLAMLANFLTAASFNELVRPDGRS